MSLTTVAQLAIGACLVAALVLILLSTRAGSGGR